MNVLLHICCGVCAGSVIERLLSESHGVTGYFFNPNIYPAPEYVARLEVARRVCDWLRAPLVAGEYRPDRWQKAVSGLEKEPEGGRRCEVCYRVRLTEAHRFALANGFDVFTSTLTVSPHKPASVVNRVGQEVGGAMFLARDFKKQDGFKRANQIARELDIYRQHYCGCIYSLPPAGNSRLDTISK
jgi:predicted adenine nucleotide alpha hydrolase (AANH) superfamily ATPase